MFPADAARLRELDDAVALALGELSVVSASRIDARRRAMEAIFAGDADDHDRRLRALKEPFSFPELRAFLSRYRSTFDAKHAQMRSSIDRATVEAIAAQLGFDLESTTRRLELNREGDAYTMRTMVDASLRLALHRLERVRELGAPDVIVEHELDNARRIATPGYRFDVDVGAAWPDRTLAAAQVTDPAACFGEGPPLLYVDLMEPVLLAIQCCIEPTAESIEIGDDVDGLGFRELVEARGQEAPVLPELSDGSIVLAPHVGDAEGTVERLVYAVLAESSPWRRVAPGGALVAVTMSESEDGDEA